MLEGAKRRATKLIQGLMTMLYEETLTRLNMPTLAEIRLVRDGPIETCTILNGKDSN